MRTINMTVTGDLVAVDSTVLGVQGSGNADTIRLTLDAAWDGWAKTAVWWDGHGVEAVSQVLTATMLEDVAVSTRCYLLPVPPEALRYGGVCTLVLDGYADNARARTISTTFEVSRAPMRKAVAGDVTSPTEIEQMQEQVESLLAAESVRVAAEQKRVAAETDRAEAETTRAKAESERADREVARVNAEKGRADTERERVAEEKTRISHENDRKTAEQERAAAEEKRASAEKERETAEQGRASAEKTRADAETDRGSAEQERAVAEEKRASVEKERENAEQGRASAEKNRADAEQAREAGEKRRDAQMQTIVERTADAINAAGRVETAQAALHSRRRILIGTATDAERLMPGDELIIVDDSSVVSVTDYQDLLLEAQQAAAGEENDLETLAVLSAVNATNLRRTADGLLWTTDTLADFCSKLTAFAAAAVAAGYVTTDGQCVATWAQAQAWLLEETLVNPIDAEGRDYYWRAAEPKTEYDDMKERLTSVEAQLGSLGDYLGTLITGGSRQ